MRMIHTHNALRLGDNLIQINFLRRACLLNNDVTFVHYFDPNLCNGNELLPFIEGLESRIIIKTMEECPRGSIDSWRGPLWYSHPQKLDFAAFHLFWFSHLSEKMGIDNPIKSVDDLLFDYPLLSSSDIPTYDAVVINSRALSGQFNNYDLGHYDVLIKELLNAGISVLTTHPTSLCDSSAGHGVAWIGAVSAKAKLILGTSTGPSWPCFNVLNKNAKHILCLDTENVILTPRGSVARNVPQISEILRSENFI